MRGLMICRFCFFFFFYFCTYLCIFDKFLAMQYNDLLQKHVIEGGVMFVTCLEALVEYRGKFNSNNVSDRYAALGFALQLPGICGRLEFPPDDETNVQSSTINKSDALYKRDKHAASGYVAFDKNMFVHWFQNHHLQFVPLFHVQGASVEQLASELYELRNSLTHEGIVKGFCEHIVLVDGVNSGFVHTGRFFVEVR